jgi:putative ABC transport system substrate-binding protein
VKRGIRHEPTGNSKKAELFAVVFCAVVALHSFVGAQHSKKIPRIGFLEGATVAESQGLAPFQQGLRDLGYIDAQNIIIEVKSMEGKPQRVPDLLVQFIRRKIDILVTPVGAGAQGAKRAMPNTPVVVIVPDPVGAGLVGSLSRPGGNVTGLATQAELAGKRLEILKDVLPSLNRVGLVWDPDSISMDLQIREMTGAANALGIKLQRIELRSADDVETVFKGIAKNHSVALIALRSPLLVNQRKQFLRLAAENRIPVMYDDKNFVEPGGLISYGPDRGDLFRRAAGYVDRILKGAKPADLPVEQPTKFELVINLQTAKQIGLTIPPNMLARADRVIR